MLCFVEHQTTFIIDSTTEVKSSNDFLVSTNGMVLFNSTCMCLQSIGEVIRKIDDKTNGQLFKLYPEIPWKQIISMRNIISHEYLSIDPDLIFDIIYEELPPLKETLLHIQADIHTHIHDKLLSNLLK